MDAIQQVIRWLLRKKSNHEQDRYFVRRLGQLISELEMVRNDTDLPGKIATYDRAIGLCKSAQAYINNPALIHETTRIVMTRLHHEDR